MSPDDRRQRALRLFDEHGSAVYRFALVLLRHHQDAEDVVQETFVKLLEHLSTGVPGHSDSNVRGWLFSSHVLSEVESTCDRVGLIRAGTLVSQGTIADIRRRSPRRVTVRFSRPVEAPVPSLEGVATVSRAPQCWVLDVTGPAGPLVAALASLPVDDMDVEPFKLEDHMLKLYAPCEC